MKKVMVIHGPNLNLLSIRETDKYGVKSLKEINDLLYQSAINLNIEIEIFQNNSEGSIIDNIHNALSNKVDGIIINPGGYTHYSISIRDAIAAVKIPTIEVHLTNIYARERFRQVSVIAPVSNGSISGFGYNSYLIALDAICKLI